MLNDLPSWRESDVPHWEESVEIETKPADADALKKEIKKLSAQAMELKMNLHDLSEELPTNWERIPEIAEHTFEAFKRLTEARQRLAAAG